MSAAVRARSRDGGRGRGRGRARSPLSRLWRRAVGRARHAALGLPGAGRVLAATGRRPLFVLGDSHTRVFDRVADSGRLPHTVLDVERVLGATALGLANPNSSTNALVRFRRALRRVPRSTTVLVMLGEVDVGYLVWHRAASRGTTVAQEFEVSLSRLAAFLDGLRADGRTDLVVALVPLPTVPDYREWAGLDNARSTVTASQRERTDLTVAYNARLRAWAAAAGAAVLDYEADLLDPATGLVAERYRSRDPLNHHLDAQAFCQLVTDRLRGLGFS